MPVEQGVVRDSEAVGLTLKEALQGTLGRKAAGSEETDATAEQALETMPDLGTKG